MWQVRHISFFFLNDFSIRFTIQPTQLLWHVYSLWESKPRNHLSVMHSLSCVPVRDFGSGSVVGEQPTATVRTKLLRRGRSYVAVHSGRKISLPIVYFLIVWSCADFLWNHLYYLMCNGNGKLTYNVLDLKKYLLCSMHYLSWMDPQTIQRFYDYATSLCFWGQPATFKTISILQK